MIILCNCCKKPKDPEDDFGSYIRNGKKKKYRTCRSCQNQKARARHQRRMLSPKKRKKHNKRTAKNKKKEYHTNKDFREKCKSESRIAYLRECEEIKAFARRKYALDFEFRENAKDRAKKQQQKKERSQEQARE